MTKHLNNQENYSTYQPSLLLDFNYSFERDIRKDDIVHTIIEVIGKVNLGNILDLNNYDKREYDPVKMLTVLVLGFSENGYMSLRQLEKFVRNDIRCRFIMGNELPSYKSFHRFIEKRLKKSIEEIQAQIYLAIQSEEELNKQILYIDGTKFEANANKMTFVWRGWGKRHYPTNWKKSMQIVTELNTYFRKNEIDIKYSILKEPNIYYLTSIDEALEQWIMANKKTRNGRGKHEIAKLCDKLKPITKKLMEYQLQFDILGKRNSFSKTDCDATFMHMKYDYYNHTNVFKPGYNVQIGVSGGYIAYTYISGDANDVKTLQPFSEGYNKQFGYYPKTIVGDAGYGSYNNYLYCYEKGIKGVLKYSGYEKKKEKVSDKNRYKLSHMPRNEKGIPICPQGHTFTFEKSSTSQVEQYSKTIHFYRNEHCEDCPVRNMCTKSKNGRTAQITVGLEMMQQDIDGFLKSTQGISMMMNRSSQAEGAFADIKQNFQYTRLRRRGNSPVKVEIGLVSIGYNIRKYHNKNTKKESLLS